MPNTTESPHITASFRAGSRAAPFSPSSLISKTIAPRRSTSTMFGRNVRVVSSKQRRFTALGGGSRWMLLAGGPFGFVTGADVSLLITLSRISLSRFIGRTISAVSPRAARPDDSSGGSSKALPHSPEVARTRRVPRHKPLQTKKRRSPPTFDRRDIQLRGARQQAIVESCDFFLQSDESQFSSRHYPTDAKSQIVDIGDEFGRFDGLRQHIVGEFDDEPDVRRPGNRVLHAAHHERLVAFDIDLNQIDRKIPRQEGVDRGHLDLYRAPLISPERNIGHRAEIERLGCEVEGTSAGSIGNQ